MDFEELSARLSLATVECSSMTMSVTATPSSVVVSEINLSENSTRSSRREGFCRAARRAVHALWRHRPM